MHLSVLQSKIHQRSASASASASDQKIPILPRSSRLRDGCPVPISEMSNTRQSGRNPAKISTFVIGLAIMPWFRYAGQKHEAQMAIVREFYLREKTGEVESFALARDVITDRIYVLHGRGRSRPELSYSEDNIKIGDFLHGEGPEQTALLELIGTLVVEE